MGDDRIFEIIKSILDQLPIQVRVGLRKGEVSDWSSFLTIPSPSYVELKGSGPEKKEDIEFIEIDPISMQITGKLVKPKLTSFCDEIQGILNAGGVTFSVVQNDIFRILL